MAFSVSARGELDTVSRYIDNQEHHHRTGKLSDLLETTEGNEEDKTPWESP